MSVLVPFADLGTGIRSVLTILQANANPTAVEFMERKVVALGEEFCRVKYPRPDAGSYILLTFDGHESEVNANIERVRRLALDNGAIDYIVLRSAEPHGGFRSLYQRAGSILRRAYDRVRSCG